MRCLVATLTAVVCFPLHFLRTTRPSMRWRRWLAGSAVLLLGAVAGGYGAALYVDAELKGTCTLMGGPAVDTFLADHGVTRSTSFLERFALVQAQAAQRVAFATRRGRLAPGGDPDLAWVVCPTWTLHGH